MKTTHLLLLFFCYCIATLQAQQVFRLDSIINQQWNTNAWQNLEKTHYFYDNGGDKETLSRNFVFTDDQWVLATRTKTSYNDNNDILEAISQSYNTENNSWFNVSKDNYNYENNKLTRFVSNIFITNWSPQSSRDYTYDNFGNNIEVIKQIATPPVSPALINFERDLNTYENTNQLKQSITQQWLNNSWQNVSRENLTYPNNSSVYPTKTEKFDWLGSSWSNVVEVSNVSYNSNNDILEVVQQKDNNGTLQFVSRLTNTYDINNTLTETLGEQWQTNSWVNSSKFIYNYQSENINETIIQNWQSTNWVNSLRNLFYWKLADNLSLNIETLANVNVYPNPTQEKVNILFGKATHTKINASLYTISGQLISKQLIPKGATQASFIIHQSSGIYMLHLQDTNSKQVYKIVKS